jgi:hypothetical protein
VVYSHSKNKFGEKIMSKIKLSDLHQEVVMTLVSTNQSQTLVWLRSLIKTHEGAAKAALIEEYNWVQRARI